MKIITLHNNKLRNNGLFANYKKSAKANHPKKQLLFGVVIFYKNEGYFLLINWFKKTLIA
jgi:hypothetical protein